MDGSLPASFALNARAATLVDSLRRDAAALRVAFSTLPGGTTLIDCGTHAPGGLEAGRLLAEICLGGLGKVQFVPATREHVSSLAVMVTTDQPVAACMASQYAGWQLAEGKFFAMGSGPMRAAGSRESLFEHIGYRERPAEVVGVLETATLPPDSIALQIAADCGVPPAGLTLLVARTHSLAGTIQVVARSVETALHKLHALGYDLARIVSGSGLAPVPPVASDFLTGIGRTNDAVLYGGEVTLWLHDDDARLAELGPQVPSSASSDYGAPFREIFQRYDRDFYRIDPLLFSPAVVTLVNLATGRRFQFGQLQPQVLAASFA
jgi:methenyltetrahydromethanopterin cyclohydrolase